MLSLSTVFLLLYPPLSLCLSTMSLTRLFPPVTPLWPFPPLVSLFLNLCFKIHLLFLIPACFPFLLFLYLSLCCGCVVHITHSQTSESMSFHYQRTQKSVSVATRPSFRVSHPLFEDEEEEEYEGNDGQLEHGCQPLALTYEQPPPEPDCSGAGEPACWFKVQTQCS